MRTINDEWEDYLEKVLPSDAGEVQIRETRQAFIAGATSLVALLNSHSDQDGERILENLLSSVAHSVSEARRRAADGQ